MQLVFANVIPRQESDAAGDDQQHDRDIDHRILDITGERASEFDGKLMLDGEYDWGQPIGREVW